MGWDWRPAGAGRGHSSGSKTGGAKDETSGPGEDGGAAEETGMEPEEGSKEGADGGAEEAGGWTRLEDGGRNSAGLSLSIETVTVLFLRCRSNVFGDRRRTRNWPS